MPDPGAHYTYSGDPAVSDLDWIRWRVGDTNLTDSTTRLQSDEEIQAAIADSGSIDEAAIKVCQAIAAHFARECDRSIRAAGAQDIVNALSQKYKHYTDLLIQLQADLAATAAPYAGGISLADKAANEGNADNNPPPFARGQFDYL